jgi:hypothetical protein
MVVRTSHRLGGSAARCQPTHPDSNPWCAPDPPLLSEVGEKLFNSKKEHTIMVVAKNTLLIN